MADGMAVLEPIETGSEVDASVETHEVTTEQPAEGAEVQQPTDDDPYSAKTSKEYSTWLKGIRDSDPSNPNNAKYARIAKDDHARLYQLNQLEPKGIDGVREKYALLDSVVHNDPERGELRGTEAVAAMQDQLRGYSETDELLASGDPRALESLGEDFNEGLAKLTPSILDRVRESNPEAYAAAVLPHFVEALKSSELVADYNGLVDILNEKPPAWLPEDRKQAWLDDRINRVIERAGNMGRWLNAQAEKAAQKPQTPARSTNGRFQGKEQAEDPEARANKVLQDHHWSTQIEPKLDQHAAARFSELFKPFDKRLRLDGPTMEGLKSEFSKRVASMAAKDSAYMAQIKRYRSQNNPDPSAVVNYAKVQFDKHAKTVMDSLVNERYKPFLTGKPKASPTTPASNGSQPANKGPVAPNVQIVTVKPPMNEIDHKNTPLDWLHQKKYRLTNGKVVQVRN